MATNASGEFEAALKRLEEIVGTLERENVSLDQSVLLFQEGKGLAQTCERLLKAAQSSIEAAARGESSATPPGRPAGVATPLFGAGASPDDDPDL